MIIVIIAIIMGLCGFYYFRYRKKNEYVISEKNDNELFIPSNTFIGGKKGYVFKNDKNGLGYYIDNYYN